MMRNIKLVLAYDGGNYHGFQRQNNAIAIQQIIEKNLEKLVGHKIEKLAASGRTDTGVHARGQVINFYTTGSIPIANIKLALNSLLPEDIVVLAATEMPLEFSARHSAVSKKYKYYIRQGDNLDPFQRNYSWYIRKSLNVQEMQLALQYIEGTHDFSSFRATGSSPLHHPVRTIFQATVEKNSDNELVFVFWGNGFLYHMVRNVVGTVVNVGKGKITPEKFKEILEAKNRQKAGITAPPQGLFLEEVFY